MEEARYRALTLVNKLKNSCLLLDDPESETFSEHDVVRHVAMSIASRDQHVIATNNIEAPPTESLDKDTLKICTAISLHNCKIGELVEGALKTARLRAVPNWELDEEYCWAGDLNTTLQHLNEKMAKRRMTEVEYESEMSTSEEIEEEEEENAERPMILLDTDKDEDEEYGEDDEDEEYGEYDEDDEDEEYSEYDEDEEYGEDDEDEEDDGEDDDIHSY
ncbi:hypothetical protein WN944_007463 [Citrus x changshan-huyou]|uniref:Uncharacterized protein n=1 Tax=Citrus x changshan-huyou TaxID=2935761 RepID=A0AAP0QQF7_9ROSI